MTTTASPASPDVASESVQLEKAAEHYKLAAHHYHEASKKREHGHDNEVDHHVRHGAAHAAHAYEHAKRAADLHASGVTACACRADG